jgi:hypothetical protein
LARFFQFKQPASINRFGSTSISGEKVDVAEIVLILAIEKRKDFRVFKVADKCLNELKALLEKAVQETIKNHWIFLEV